MMDREELNKLLMERGASPQQCKAKILDLALDILGGQSEAAQEILKKKIDYIDLQYENAKELEKYIARRHEGMAKDEKILEQAKKELEENKNRFEQQLSQLETAEGRDKLKLAYLFYNFRFNHPWVAESQKDLIGKILD